MPLPAIAAVAARVVGSAAVKTVAKSAGKAAVKSSMKSFTGGGSTHPSYPARPGHAALSQNQFPESPPWGSVHGGIGTP